MDVPGVSTSDDNKNSVTDEFKNWFEIVPSIEEQKTPNYNPPYADQMPPKSPVQASPDMPWYKMAPSTDQVKREESENLRNWVIQHSQNPEEELAKLRSAQYLAAKADIDPTYVYNNFEAVTKDYYGQPMSGMSTFQAINNSWKTGKIYSQLGDLYYQQINGDSTEETQAKIDKLKSSLPPVDQQKRWIPTQALKAAAEMIPMSIDGAKEATGQGLVYGLGGATTAAIGGQAGPQVAFPEEIVTIPSAFASMYLVGQLSGMAESTFKKESGLAYMDMLEYQDTDGARIDPEIAKMASIGIGALNAVVETTQFTTLPGVDNIVKKATSQAVKKIIQSGTLRKVAWEFSKEYGGSIASETAQEMLQEIFSITGEEISKGLSGVRGSNTQEIVERLMETAKQSALAFSVMGLPGSVMNANVSSAVRQMRSPVGIIKVDDTTVIPGPDSKLFRTSTTSTAASIQSIEIAGNTSNEGIKLAQQQYEAAKDGKGTIPPVKVIMGEDGTYQAVDNDMLQVLLENGEQALEVEIVEPIQNTKITESLSKPNWMKNSQDFNEWKSSFTQREAQFKEAQTIEDFEYNVRTAFPDIADSERQAVVAMVEARAAVNGMDVSEYIQNTFDTKVFTTEKIPGQSYKAAAEFKESGKALIHLTELSDFSSWVHEYGHIIRKELPQSDLQILQDHYGDQDWTTESEESFVRDFEDYLHKGKAPSEELRTLFQKIAAGLKKVFDRIGRTLDETRKLSAEVTDVFDRIFTPQGDVKADLSQKIQQEQQNWFVAQPTDQWFEKTENSRSIPLEQIERREEIQDTAKLQRAQENIHQAEAGTGPKRAPVKVLEISKGKYRIVDGNTTWHVLKDKNAAALEAEIVEMKQPTRDLSELYSLVEESLEDLDSFTAFFADKFKGSVLQRPVNKESGKRLKARDRAARKLEEVIGAERIFDLAGSTVVFKDITTIKEAVKTALEDPRVIRLKDRYDKPAPGGYMDVLMNIRAKNGAVIEVQFNTLQMVDAKKKAGHTLYEVIDQTETAFKEGKISDSEKVAAIKAAVDASEKIYSAAKAAILEDNIFSMSSFDISEELVIISDNLTRSPAGESVLSGKTLNKLKELSMAIGKSSQSANFNPSESMVMGSDINKSSDHLSILDQADGSNIIDLKDLLFQGIELYEDSDGVMYNKHEKGFNYESKELSRQFQKTSEELGLLEEGGIFSDDGGDEGLGEKRLSGRPTDNSLLQQWKKQKRIDFTNQIYEDTTTLAEMFSVYRNPLNEYFHIIYTNDNNQILAHNVMSSGIPGRTIAVDSSNPSKSMFNLEERMKRLNATGYYLLHNHPSGNVSESNEDLRLTANYAQNVKGFIGHIILNHDQFGFIGRGLHGTQHKYSPKVEYISRNLTDKGFTSPQMIADYTKSMMPDDGRELLLYLDNQNRVVLAEPVKKINHQTAYQKMREIGASNMAFATSSRESYDSLWKADVELQNSSELSIKHYDVFLDILLMEFNDQGEFTNVESAVEWTQKRPSGWQSALMSRRKRRGYVWEDEILYQNTEHEEIIRKAIEEFKPVPQDVLDEYGDRDWAIRENRRRETLKKYSWLVDMAFGMDSPDEFKDFILRIGSAEEIDAARKLGGEGEERFYKEIWSRANLKTREQANNEFIKRYANETAVTALAIEVTANPGVWKGKGIPGSIWMLGNSFKGSTKQNARERFVQAAITSVKNNPLAIRQAFASQSGDQTDITQLQYEEEIENATPEEVVIGRLSTEDRLKEAAKADDPKIRAMLLSGIGTDSESLVQFDREMHQRMGVLKSQHTKEVEKLKNLLKASDSKLDDFISSRERLSDALKNAKSEAEKEAYKKIQEFKAEMIAKQKQQKEVQEIKDRMRKLAKNILRKPAEDCHYSFKEEIREIQDGLDGRFRRQKTAEALKKRREFYEANPEVKKLIDPEILKVINQKPLNEWTLIELENLNNKVNRLRQMGKEKQQRIVEDRKQKVLELASKMALEIGNGKIATVPKYATNTDDYKEWKKTGKVDAVMLNTLRPSRILKDLAGENSELVKFFWEKMNQHTDESIRRKLERIEAGKRKMAELGITKKELAQKILIPGAEEDPQSVNDVIHMYITRKNEKNWRAIVHGVGVKNPGKYIQHLTAEQMALGDFIAADFEAHHERYAEAYAVDKNDILGKVPGYFPMKRQSLLNEARNDEVMRDMGTSAGVMDGYASRNSTKKRIDIGDEHQAPIRMGAWDLWMEEVEKQEHYIASARYIKEMHGILKNPAFQAALVEKHGHGIIQWFEKYINEFANPNLYKYYDAVSKVSRVLRNNTALAYLAYNTLTIAKQAPSLALFMGRVGPHRLMAASGKFMSNPVKWLDFVNERDPQMKERSMDRLLEELKLEQEHPVQKAISQLGQIGMKPIMMVDKMATTIGWLAVYDAHILQGEDVAIKKAQESILETQPAARAKDLAMLYKSNEGFNWFLMFTNQINQQWNIMTSDIPRAVRQAQVNHI